MLVREGVRAEDNKEEKKWDNCNSIINNIYLKIKFGLYSVNSSKPLQGFKLCVCVCVCVVYFPFEKITLAKYFKNKYWYKRIV